MVGKPLKWWLSRDTFISSILLVLDILRSIEASPYVITCSIKEQLYLYAQCSSWGVNKLARLLLDRANFDIPRKILSPSLDEAKISKMFMPDEKVRAILAGNLDKILEPFEKVCFRTSDKNS